MRRLICKVTCKFSQRDIQIIFRKGILYSVVLENRRRWMINLEEKKESYCIEELYSLDAQIFSTLTGRSKEKESRSMKSGDRLLCRITYYKTKNYDTPNFVKGKVYSVISEKGHIRDEHGYGILLEEETINTIFTPFHLWARCIKDHPNKIFLEGHYYKVSEPESLQAGKVILEYGEW